MILTPGFMVLIAFATPAIKPPPPTGITAASRSGTCSNISKPIVPCPAKISGWSNLMSEIGRTLLGNVIFQMYIISIKITNFF